MSVERNVLAKFLAKNWLTILLTVVPPVALWFFLERDVSEVTVEVVAIVPVVEVEQEFSDGIQVFYDSTEVDGLRVVELAIENTGNTPLPRDAYEQPIRVEFDAVRVTQPEIIGKSSPSLAPTVGRSGETAIEILPLLLNPADRFSLRTFLVNPMSDSLSVGGRIEGVSEVVLERAEPPESPLLQLLLPLLAALAAASVSILSGTRLVREAKFLRVSLGLPMGLALDLTSKIQERLETSAGAAQLADELEISGHDFKTNFLLLRIKIESLLREIAARNDLEGRVQRGSPARIARELGRRGLIAHEVQAAISDLSPGLNRELHEVETYLSDSEFLSLQELALNVIVALEESLGKGDRQMAP